jgi:dTDP-4-amino-4,6-dideoxygalactose transaminase
MSMPIPFFSLERQWSVLKDSVTKKITTVLDSGQFVGGPFVEEFEKKLAQFLGVNYAISCNSGTDALYLALRALELKKDSIVLTTPFSFIASSSEIISLGGHPVFIDIDSKTYNLSPQKLEAWLEKNATKDENGARHIATGLPISGIIAVNIFGQCADFPALRKIANEWSLWIVEDAAQSLGAHIDGTYSGALGDIATFSFYPTKNLGAFGDAGALTTHSEKLAARIRQVRNHGRPDRYDYREHGINSRLDGIQAAVLSEKIGHLKGWNERRREIAALYEKGLSKLPFITIPQELTGEHIYHQYCIKVGINDISYRDELVKYLTELKIGSNIFYPQSFTSIAFLNSDPRLKNECPIADRTCKTIMALPVWPELTNDEVMHIIKQISAFAPAPALTIPKQEQLQII